MSRSAIRQRKLVELLLPPWIVPICLCKQQLTFQTFQMSRSILLFRPKALDWIRTNLPPKPLDSKGKPLHGSIIPLCKLTCAQTMYPVWVIILQNCSFPSHPKLWWQGDMNLAQKKKLNHKYRQQYLAAPDATGRWRAVDPAISRAIPELSSNPIALRIQWLPAFFPVMSRWTSQVHQWAGSGILCQQNTPYVYSRQATSCLQQSTHFCTHPPHHTSPPPPPLYNSTALKGWKDEAHLSVPSPYFGNIPKHQFSVN